MTEKKFYCPTTLKKALYFLNVGDVTIIAGGTDLVKEITKKSLRPKKILDLTHIPELKGINVSGDKIRIGSMSTFSELAANKLLQERCRLLSEAALSVGSPQIRNRGTIGGNIVSRSPAADCIPPLMALDAKLHLFSLNNNRDLSLVEFLNQSTELDLEEDEIVESISFKLPKKEEKSVFIKMGRRNALAISRISMALRVIPDQEGNIRKACICLGAVGLYPIIAEEAQDMLIGLNKKSNLEPVLKALSKFIIDIIGYRKSAPYKKQAVKGIALEAWDRIWE